MAIYLFTGRPRQGKTYQAVRMIFKDYLCKGIPVKSNILLNWDYMEEKTLWKKFLMKIGLKKTWKEYPKENLTYWKKLDDLYDFKNGAVLMDEAHVYMRARKWESLPEDMERKLAQHGKHRLDLIATTQHQDRIDKIMREIVDYWYVCVKGIFFFMRYEFDIDGDKQKKYILSKRYITKKKKYYLSYDSYAEVKVGEIGNANFEIQDGF